MYVQLTVIGRQHRLGFPGIAEAGRVARQHNRRAAARALAGAAHDVRVEVHGERVRDYVDA